jgi:putative glycosyltransferase (TIGR04372 family)
MSLVKKYFVRRRLRRLVALTLTAVTAPFQILVFIMLRIASKVIPIRCGWIITPRIGHMAANFELLYTNLLVTQAQGGKRGITIWVPSQEHVCNRFLFKLIKRQVFVVPRWLWIVVHQLNLMFPGGSIIDLGSGTDRDVSNLLDRTSPSLEFSNSEIRKGNKFLESIGLPKGARFVCLTVRDSSYLASVYPQNDWSYHDYRNSSIINYIPAVEELTRRGYFVFRMGAVVDRPFLSQNPMIIDYSFNGMRTEFLDIFLGAHCSFCVSTGTGFDAVPFSFRRPIVFVNMAPIGWLPTFSIKFLLLAKTHVWSHDKTKLTFEEIMKAGVAFASKSIEFSKAGVQLMENTPEQIRQAVVEMDDRINSRIADDPMHSDALDQFWKNYCKIIASQCGTMHGNFVSKYAASEFYKSD